MKKFIPVYQPNLSGNEKKYVLDCLNSSWISSKGSYISKFEKEFAKFHQVKHATSVSNGTVALHIALLSLGVGAGDEVIVPTFTYVASVNAISYVGAKPVFVDSLSDSWQMNYTDIEKNISKKTKAILVVHLYGQPCEMNEIIKIAKKHKLYVVEDCAEAIGSEYNGRKVGVFGDISTFSFFGNKTITTGEGGMVVTNNSKLIDKARHYKGQGLVNNREYWHDVVGYNYRMTNICAAIGLAQLEQVEDTINKKLKVAKYYKDLIDKQSLPIEIHNQQPNTVHTYWMFSILTKAKKDRDPLREALKKAGVETRPLFYPVHTMPMYMSKSEHPVAKNLSKRGMNLPSYPSLKKSDIEYITKTIAKYYAAK